MSEPSPEELELKQGHFELAKKWGRKKTVLMNSAHWRIRLAWWRWRTRVARQQVWTLRRRLWLRKRRRAPVQMELPFAVGGAHGGGAPSSVRDREGSLRWR